MKTIFSRPRPFTVSVPLLPLLPAALILLVPAGRQAKGDLREAVKKLLPATVAVEWRAADSESSARLTRVFRIKNTKAEAVADVLKAVLGDRLSDPGKRSSHEDQQQQGSDKPSRYTYYTYVFDGEPGASKEKKRLSIGVDAGSNAVIVSAPKTVFPEIERLIQDLDKAADPSAEAIQRSIQKKTAPRTVVPSKTPGQTWAFHLTPPFTPPNASRTPDTVILASGTVLSSDGLIATLPGETEDGTWSVTLHDGRTLEAKMVVDDRRSGLKLLKVDAEDLPQVEIAAGEAELGQQVVTVFATDVTRRAVAQGIVASTKPLRHGRASDVFQTDFNVDAMSAGAPVADTEGRVVGLVAGTAGRDGAPQEGTLVVPAVYLISLADARDDETTAVIHRPILGVQIGLSDKSNRVIVERVLPDSAAVAAGIREGDEIATVDGRGVVVPEDATRYVLRRMPGDRITVVIRRDGEEKSLEATLGTHETKPQTTTTGKPPKVEAVRPESTYIFTKDGTLHAISPNGDSLTAETLRLFDKAFVAGSAVPSTIRVQRSDVEKKLDQLNGDVQSLKGQMEKLIEELGKLRAQLAEDSAAEK